MAADGKNPQWHVHSFAAALMLLHYTSYAAILAAFAFVTLSLASGLLYVSELIEERSRLAKVVGKRGIYTIIVLHILLYFFDSLPFRHTLFSIACHVVYLQNFSHTWPVISLTSASFVASCIMVIADHFIWFFYFARVSEDSKARHRSFRPHPAENLPGFTEIATFFGICVWLAPLFLFLSLSANDNALPMSAAIVSETDNPMAPSMTAKRSRGSLFKSLFSNLSVEMPRMGHSRKNTSEGLIAPRSPLPVPPRSPSMYRTSSSSSRTSPPRSPGFQANLNGMDAHLSPHNFKLNTPPKRTSLPSPRRSTMEGLGLGLRKSSMGGDDDDSKLK